MNSDYLFKKRISYFIGYYWNFSVINTKQFEDLKSLFQTALNKRHWRLYWDSQEWWIGPMEWNIWNNGRWNNLALLQFHGTWHFLILHKSVNHKTVVTLGSRNTRLAHLQPSEESPKFHQPSDSCFLHRLFLADLTFSAYFFTLVTEQLMSFKLNWRWKITKLQLKN